VSLPRENVLFVPRRNVLLTGPGWESGRNRDSQDDPAGQRSFGSAQKGTEEADYASAGRPGTGAQRAAGAAAITSAEGGWGQGRDSRPAGAALEAKDQGGPTGADCEDSVAGSVPRLRADAGERVPAGQAPGEDRPGSAAADHDRGGAVARAAGESRGGARVAAATELPRGDGAVGHQRARLAGGTWGQAVFDPYDRRCDQRTDGAVCAARLHRGEHAAVVEVPGAAWAAGVVLHRQGEFIPHRGEGETRPERAAAGRARAAAADADRPRAPGTRDCVAGGALAASQGLRFTLHLL